ncbi:MAG: ATP-dependent Clp protease ATP-binding subunit ClpX, partial [Spirochaetes bacterium]|nr:ATP-dependent Clp protease ATP-binding subunit ClpX [Spirochaetota bacterium]
ELEFTSEAIDAIAQIAIERETGARGLRSVLEEIMLDLMYEIPSKKTIAKVVINDDVVLHRKPPEIIQRTTEKSA